MKMMSRGLNVAPKSVAAGPLSVCALCLESEVVFVNEPFHESDQAEMSTKTAFEFTLSVNPCLPHNQIAGKFEQRVTKSRYRCAASFLVAGYIFSLWTLNNNCKKMAASAPAAAPAAAEPPAMTISVSDPQKQVSSLWRYF